MLKVLQQPAPAPTLPVLDWGTILGPGATGPVVQAFEQRLADLHFDPGAVDGVYDQATLYAVQALQKIAGINPAGRLGVLEAEALRNFQYPQPLHPDAEPNRTEIDVTHQVLTLYENYQVRLVTTTSTASGVHYCYDWAMTSAPCPVRTVEERMPMRLTVPDNVPISITSPTPTGRSTMRIRPDTKLLTTFCSPKPMPTPTALASSVTFAMSMPSAASVSAAPTMTMAQRVKVTIAKPAPGRSPSLGTTSRSRRNPVNPVRTTVAMATPSAVTIALTGIDTVPTSSVALISDCPASCMVGTRP